jgi:TonB-linked SusC/RagA family outer membrane protein
MKLLENYHIIIRKNLLIFFLFVVFTSLWSQSKTYSGVVQNEQNESLPGVNIKIKETNQGTISDIDGRFTLSNVPEGSKLQFTYIGFETKEVVVANQSNLKVILYENLQKLNEVVVIGYGSLSKKELSSSIVSISKENFLQSSVGNAMELISGRVAGLNVNTTAAANPNSSPSLQIRGATSLSASNSPLIVIDGVPGGNLNNLSPQDIESITVLKDGASSAIYGTRGANGVILVTTKKSTAKEGSVSIKYDSWFGINKAVNIPSVLNADEFRRSLRGADYGANTDFYQAILRNLSYDNNQYLSIDGASKNGYYGASLNYRKATGIDIASQKEEYAGRLTVSQKMLDGLVVIGGSLNARQVKQIWGDDGQFQNALTMNPTMPIYNPNGSYYHPTYPVNSRNPVEELTDHQRGGDRIYLLGSTDLKVNLIQYEKHNLNTSITYSSQYNDLNQHDFVPSTASESEQNIYKGRASLQYQKWWDNSFEWLGNYMFSPNKDNSLKTVFGYSYQEYNYESRAMANYDFPYDSFLWNNIQSGSYLAAGKATMSTSKNQSKLIGFFGRANYNWKDIVMASVSFRREGSTKFGSNNKWGNFPAASIALEMVNMNFLKDKTTLESLKPRISYGVTGRSDFDSYQSLVTYAAGGEYFIDGQWINAFGPSINANPNLRWEKGITTNIGIDFSLIKGRIYGSVDLFDRRSEDLLYRYSAPQPPMIYQTILVNVGTTSNKGIEFSLNTTPLKTKNLKLDVGFVYSYGTTKLSKLSNDFYKATYLDLYKKPGVGTEEYLFRAEQGGLVGQFYGYKHAGVSPDGSLLIYNKAGEIITKGAESPEDKQHIGNGSPKHLFSINNTLTYKNFDLNIFLRGAAGFNIMNYGLYSMGLQMSGSQNVLRDAYLTYNPITKDGNILSSFYLEKGDYIKIENISLGYSLKLNGKHENKYIESLRTFVSAKNLYTLTGYTGNDPSIVFVNGLTPGVDTGAAYPNAIQLSLGVSINLK